MWVLWKRLLEFSDLAAQVYLIPRKLWAQYAVLDEYCAVLPKIQCGNCEPNCLYDTAWGMIITILGNILNQFAADGKQLETSYRCDYRLDRYGCSCKIWWFEVTTILSSKNRSLCDGQRRRTKETTTKNGVLLIVRRYVAASRSRILGFASFQFGALAIIYCRNKKNCRDGNRPALTDMLLGQSRESSGIWAPIDDFRLCVAVWLWIEIGQF